MKQQNEHIEENPFSLSVGDLMAAVLLLFVLLLSAAMLRITEQTQKIDKVTQDYQETKRNIVIGLQSEFGNNLHEWEAIIDTATLSVRFQKESIMFKNDSSNLSPHFKEMLSDFFPRYVAILKQYQDDIEEIRIEGHTSSTGTYYHNMELSQARTRKVLMFCESMAAPEDLTWMRKKITANGLSFSHPILNHDGTEDQTLSRRVEFRIITTSEQRIDQIVDLLQE